MIELKKEFLVREVDTAKFMGSGDLEVLASPALVAMAENVSMEICQTTLKIDETTVGASFELQHLKATILGQKIQVQATLQAQEERSYLFEIQVFEEKKLIATATHQRVRVNREKFMAKLNNSN